jgi:carotenoid cleavage dioxygenase-like enzyme
VILAVTDLAPGLERAFAFVPRERSCPVAVEGDVPAFLRGTYYLNGPARFERGGVRYRHWLDGDGMVCALTLFDGGARFACRFVRSGKYTAEEEAGQALFRTFGTAFPGDRLVRGIALESPVNVSVYPWGDTLLAFGEQGIPWELDPVTLETRGLYTFGGALNPVTPFAAHPKIDPETGELFNFGVSFASASTASMPPAARSGAAGTRWSTPARSTTSCSGRDTSSSTSAPTCSTWLPSPRARL